MMGDFAINCNADMVILLRNWEGTTTLSISSRTSVIRHYDKPKKMGFERPKTLNRPCHLRTHGAVAKSVADVAESEEEMVPQRTKLFVQIMT